ncbi:MAG TPA: 50S ribosomal protein L22 [Bacteroidia bacterium]|nr:50S ribosomal protein L22 [Bacteroidia bacterium]HNU34145.1 50S ribosomal protein L22 [Bacteroidia bacterium]
MGARKRKAADARKEEMKTTFLAKLNNCPTSPRKMRLVADMIRGKKVDLALNLLRFSKKEAAGRVEKLLLTALANWQSKNEGSRIDDQELVVKSIFVDSARQLKRLSPAPQGRGYRIRKRSNHVTLILDSKNNKAVTAEATTETKE